jgi:NAD(P)-dependent dehydrogenase (short-subunit alcohol dehydrogenase family)
MADLKGKIAVVTGAARGLGRATALRLARAGADVAVVDIDLNGGAQFGELLTAPSVADEIIAIGPRGFGVEADLTQKATVDAAFAKIVEALGSIDILVNVAGGALTPMDTSMPSTMSVADIKTNFDVNYLTAVLCAQAAIPDMKARKTGTIINISTIGAAMIGPEGRLSAYGSAKAAVSHLTRDLAAELGPHGIRVNAIAPGLMATSRIKAQAAERKLAQESDASFIPLQRLGRPEDIAGVVEFLASDAAGYITGQIVSVCGGMALVAH